MLTTCFSLIVMPFRGKILGFLSLCALRALWLKNLWPLWHFNFKKQTQFSFVPFVSILFYTKDLCDFCAFLRLPKTKPIKPNLERALLFSECLDSV